MDKGNMFEIAIRANLRFNTQKGQLTTEQLWDIPLRSRDEFNLDVVAKLVSKALNEIDEESFVNTNENPLKGRLELQLDIVKYVIESKLHDEKERKDSATNAKEKEKLLGILDRLQDGKLEELSEAELKKRIKALS